MKGGRILRRQCGTPRYIGLFKFVLLWLRSAFWLLRRLFCRGNHFPGFSIARYNWFMAFSLKQVHIVYFGLRAIFIGFWMVGFAGSASDCFCFRFRNCIM